MAQAKNVSCPYIEGHEDIGPEDSQELLLLPYTASPQAVTCSCDVRKNSAHSLCRHRRYRHEWNCRGTANAGIQSFGLRLTRVSGHAAFSQPGRTDIYRTS